MRPEISGDDWTEGMPEGDVGPIEILTIGTVTSPSAVPQVRRYFRRLAVLPTRPGYYAAEADAPGAHTVVELLNSPRGQWVDAGDRNYLDPDDVRALGPLTRLAPVTEVLDAVDTAAEGTGEPGDSTWIVASALSAVELQYGVQR